MVGKRRVKMLDTWEVTTYLDGDGKEQEDWELVEQREARQLRSETTEQLRERMRKIAKKRWEK